MKTTVKEYEAKKAERRTMKNLREDARMNDDFSMMQLLDVSIALLEESYFDKLETVAVKFYIGYRSYYEEVVQIGKTMFSNGTKMTKQNGFRSIEIIPEITDDMTKEMISDMYYY